ncbi:MAG TPA: class I SAM-dependent methyltransferase [Rhizomicrobium sp.]|jgi:SAM-dependent methyltransferase|nr:class I SAM-dependent methyltransferase [Rhizomicrobium sp.]
MSETTPRELRAEDGRSAFGADAANYDSARPEYPAEVYAVLLARCGLGAGTRTFEVGPGTGLATRRLLEAGASPLVAVEPDARLAAKLSERAPAATVLNAAFEDAVLEDGAFDLGCAATSFHWLEQRGALAKVARLLRSGGWWAMWWNVFGDPAREDAFHEATQPLLASLATTPSWNPSWKHPFALDREARFGDLQAGGIFDSIEDMRWSWTLVLDPAQVRALYATYSHITTMDEPERERVLDGLFDIATREFGGRVERNMITVLYMARRI